MVVPERRVEGERRAVDAVDAADLGAALGVGWSFGLALLFLCATAASTALPIAPAGAATQVGAGAAILWVAGVHKAHAVAFAVSAQALILRSDTPQRRRVATS